MSKEHPISLIEPPQGYELWFKELKVRIHNSQQRASLSVNRELIFDFLSLTEEAQEREIESSLVQHVTKFLLELGAGFAFVGRQILLNVGGEEFYVDLLFYHLRLRCYVVIELKADKFKPEHLGQLGFYLTAIDRQVADQPSNY